MNVTLNIPDEVVANLGIEEPALPRALLEAFAAEGYKDGRLTAHQVRLLLSHDSRWETEHFLAAHRAWSGLTAEEILDDAKTAAAAQSPAA